MTTRSSPAAPAVPVVAGAAPPAPLSRRSFLQGLTGLAFAGPLTLSACGATSDAGSPTGTGTSSATGVTVTDQRGVTISLPAPATRILTLPMPAASLLVAVDQGPEHLVGMHDASWVAMRDGIMGEMFPEALQIAHDVADQEFAPNVESIVALEPDVVVQWGEQGEGIIAPLENAGLQVVGLALGDQQDVAAWITLFSELLGKPERGVDMNRRIDAAYAQAKALGETRGADGPRIVYFLRFAEGLRVAAAETYNDSYITLVGGRNVAAGADGAGSGMVDVDVEQVLAWDPDIVLLGNFDEAMPEDVYDAPVWAGLSAVASRQVYKVPLGGYRWDPPSQESPLMWSWLAQLAFPGEASTLRADVADHYQFLYGMSPTQAQLDRMLWAEVNAESANYAQFDAS